MLIGAFDWHLIPAATTHAQNTVDELVSQKDTLAQKQEDLAQQREESTLSLEDQKRESAIIKQQIEAKSSEIAVNKQLLETLDAQIADKTAAITTHENTIQTLDAQIAKQQQELRVRLRRVSKKSGVTTFIQAILNSRNYADYLIGFKMSEQLSAQNEQLMQEIERNILKVEAVRNQAKTDKAALEIERTQARQVQVELEDGKAALQALYEESNALTNAMLADVQYLNEQIAAIDAQQASLQGTIDAVMEQIRLEEEERRRQEEAAKTSTTTTVTTTTTTTTSQPTTTTTATDGAEETTTVAEAETSTNTTVTSTVVSDENAQTTASATTSTKTKTTSDATTTTKKTTKTTTTTSTTKSTTTTTKAPTNDDSDDDSEDNSSNTETDEYAMPMLWPTPSCEVITSSFKYREAFGRWHNGIDIASYGETEGEPIVAAASGTVRYANRFDTWGGGYGLYLMIDHGEDALGRRILTVYAHCNEVVAYEGLEVEAGDVIAYVGDTGNSYGAHLHFEVQVDGTAVDPVGNGYVSVEGIDILG